MILDSIDPAQENQFEGAREGRGFNPAVADASNCFPVSRPAQSRACGTARGARRTDCWEPLCGGVKTPPFLSEQEFPLNLQHVTLAGNQLIQHWAHNAKDR